MAKVVKPQKKIVIYGEQGRTGTKIFGGQIFEEYLSDLQGAQGLETYDKMRRSDAQIASSLQLLKLAILQAKWNIVASPADPEMGTQTANFVKYALFGEMEYTWEYSLQQALLMLDFGFIPMEKVWELRPIPEGMKDVGLTGQAIWLKKLSPRMPNTVREWVINDTTGDLEKIKQEFPSGGSAYIDRKKLVLFVHNKEGDNYEGRSVLRSAYKHWYIKDTLEKIDAVGHERTSLGIPYFEIQEGYAYDPESEEGRTLVERLTEMARNLRVNEEAFIIMPPGVTFDLKSLGQNNAALLQSIQHHDMHVMGNILAQFMTLGQTTSGSRAVAETQRGPFDLGLLAIAANVATTFEREVIRELVEFNYGPRPGYPQLEAKGISENNKTQQALATMIAQLCQYGVIVPDEELENWIRDMLGLPTKIAIDLTGTPEGEVTEEGSLLDNNTSPSGDLEAGPTVSPELTTSPKQATDSSSF